MTAVGSVGRGHGHDDAPEVESAAESSVAEVMPSEEDRRSEEESVELSEEELDEFVLLSVPVSLLELDELDELDDAEPELPPLAVVSASACTVPISANIPAAAASVTAAAAAAEPLRGCPRRHPVLWSP